MSFEVLLPLIFERQGNRDLVGTPLANERPRAKSLFPALVPIILVAGATMMMSASLQAAQAIPDGLSASDWSSIRAAYDAGRYAIQERVNGSHAARNPAQRWRTEFDGRGFLVKPDHGNWTWGMELKACEAESFASVVPEVAIDGNRISYHWSERLEEWFLNDRRGLEQGWTIRERDRDAGVPPVTDEPLTLHLAVRGGLTPRISPNQRRVTFENADGTTALTYGGVKAWDADRNALDVCFVTSDNHTVLSVEVDDAGAVYPITIDPLAQQQAYLKAFLVDLREEDRLGFAVAVSGSAVVVGAPEEDSAGTEVNGTESDNGAPDAGAVYVFVRNGSTWTREAYIKAPNADAGDRFGSSVAIYGDTVLVGAPEEGSAATGVDGDGSDNSAGSSGAVYVFVRSGSTWSQEAYLKASNSDAGDRFGSSVAINYAGGGSDYTLVVGALREDGGTTGVDGDGSDNSAGSSGAAYIFVRSGSTWSQQAYLKASNTGTADEFGGSVAISRDTVVVGAENEDSAAKGINGDEASNGAGQSGAAYVFVRSGTTWSQEAYLKASNTQFGDAFGTSVSVSADTIVVGAWGEDSSATGVNGDQNNNNASASGAVYVYVRNGTTWSQQAYLKASNTGATDTFGSSVAISGVKVAVGAPFEDSAATGVDGDESDNSASNAGAAYIFVRIGNTWTQQAFLKASNTDEGDYFGTAVAIDGSTLIIGAPEEDGPSDNAADSGAGYTFTGVGASWSQWAILKSFSAGAGDQFGASVAVSGDTVVIGATGEDGAATGVNGDGSDNSAAGAGAAYVFVRSGTTWSQEAYLKASNADAGDFFAASVAVSGDTIVVGAPQEDSAATGVNGDGSDNSADRAGAAYVFVRTGSTWSQEAYLKASNTELGDFFGGRVAVSGDTVVVGASGEDSAATGVNGDGSDNSAAGAGAAYVFVRSGTTWSQEAYLKASNTGVGDSFYRVAVSGDTVVIGASGEDGAATGVNGDGSDNSAGSAGAAYVFVRSGTTWSQEAYLKASNTDANDSFGAPVGISGDTVVIGAILEDGGVTGVNGDGSDNSAGNAGAAYVFVRSGTTWGEEAYLKASNTDANDFFGSSVGISGDTVVIGASAEDGGATGVNGDESSNDLFESGAAYVFVRSGTTWSQEAYLKASNTGRSDEFGSSLAISVDTVVVGARFESSAATGVNGDGSDNHALGSGAAYVFVFPPGPEIRVEQPAGRFLISDGPALNLGVLVEGDSPPPDFVISNIGSMDLTGIAASLDGIDAGDFSVSSAPDVPPGGSTTITLSFLPPAHYSSGSRTATLSIASDDADENPFTITLTGTALSFESDADGDGLNDASEGQLEDLGFDWDVEQTALVNTLFGNLSGAQTNLNGAGFFDASQVQNLNIGTPLIQGDLSTGTATLTIWIERSENLQDYLPFPMTAPQTSINGAGQLEFEFPLIDGAAFFRLGTSGD